MADDALVRRYKDSLLTPHPLRAATPAIPLNPSLLKTICHDIQYYGAPYRLPGRSKLPGLPLEPPLPAGAKPPPAPAKGGAAPFAAQAREPGLELYAMQPPSYMLALLLVELRILWQLYEEMVAAEYAALGQAKNTRATAFEEFEEREGVELYKRLRPVYFRARIREPHRYLIDFLVPGGVNLAGVPVRQGVHREFAKLLAKADGLITSTPVPGFGVAPIRYIGCFRPSDLDPLPGSTLRRLSNHMIGAAIDIDSEANQHLKKPQLQAIDAILDQRVQEGHPLLTITAAGSWLAALPQNGTPQAKAQALHQGIMDISREVKEFLDQYLDDWIAFVASPSTSQDPQVRQEQERRIREDYPLLEKLAKAFGSIKPDRKTPFDQTPGVKQLRRIQQMGFVSISENVFVACLTAGLMSGTQYVGQKDTMHFEIPSQSAFIGSGGYPP